MRRRGFITALVGAVATWPSALRAQQRGQMRLIGFLLSWSPGDPEIDSWLAAFRAGLEKLGWIENQNVRFEFRWAGSDPNRTQQAARELVTLQPDLIFSSGSASTAAALRETGSIPILFPNVVDPVGQSFVKSLSRPGGNATGLVNLEPSMAGKWVELLKEIAPHLSRVAVPINPATTPYAEIYLRYFRSTAQSLGVEIVASQVVDMTAFASFIEEQRQESTGAIPMPSAFTLAHSPEIISLMARTGLPAIYFNRAAPRAGGLLSYGNDASENYRRAAAFVDRIFKGEKPGDIPVEFPTRFELVINLKTAKSLGLTVPNNMLVAADEVIE